MEMRTNQSETTPKTSFWMFCCQTPIQEAQNFLPAQPSSRLSSLNHSSRPQQHHQPSSLNASVKFSASTHTKKKKSIRVAREQKEKLRQSNNSFMQSQTILGQSGREFRYSVPDNCNLNDTKRTNNSFDKEGWRYSYEPPTRPSSSIIHPQNRSIVESTSVRPLSLIREPLAYSITQIPEVESMMESTPNQPILSTPFSKPTHSLLQQHTQKINNTPSPVSPPLPPPINIFACSPRKDSDPVSPASLESPSMKFAKKRSSGRVAAPKLRRLVSVEGQRSTIRHVASLGSYEESDHESFVEGNYELEGLMPIPEREYVSKSLLQMI